MKRIISILMLVVIVAWSIPSYANTGDRFIDGFKRVMTSPFQVSNDVKTEGANAKFLPFGLTGGFIKGCFYMVKEILSGTVDMAISPIDTKQK